MQIYNIHVAKTNLSKLIEKTINGEDLVIAKAGRPVVKLVAYKPILKKRLSGRLKGKIEIADDFDAESKEINELFYQNQ